MKYTGDCRFNVVVMLGRKAGNQNPKCFHTLSLQMAWCHNYPFNTTFYFIPFYEERYIRNFIPLYSSRIKTWKCRTVELLFIHFNLIAGNNPINTYCAPSEILLYSMTNNSTEVIVAWVIQLSVLFERLRNNLSVKCGLRLCHHIFLFRASL